MAGELGIGIVGAGSIAKGGHIPGYLSMPDRCRIVAIADIEIGRAEQLAAQFDIPHVFDSYEQLLAVDEIDAVSVCTPPNAHAPVTIAALQSGTPCHDREADGLGPRRRARDGGGFTRGQAHPGRGLSRPASSGRPKP